MSFKIDDETRLNFDKMLKESGASDNTSKIRKLKHSKKIKEQVTNMIEIKTKYKRLGKKSVDKMIETKCNWLFTNYTNIYINSSIIINPLLAIRGHRSRLQTL